MPHVQVGENARERPRSGSRYLKLLKGVLTRHVEGSGLRTIAPDRGSFAEYLLELLREELGYGDLRLVRNAPFDSEARREGRDWPAEAETMIGLRRLDNIQMSIETVLAEGIAGDLIETGAWRGGACIFMRAVLAEHGITDRCVWVADSFQGLPEPDPERYPQDADDRHWRRPELSVSLDEVQANFARYGLLDDLVRFLPGWFRETLPTAPIEQLAVLRLDGDMYESTMIALECLYPKLTPGGFCIVDDYGAIERCRMAVDDYRSAHGVGEPVTEIDWTGVYWRRAV